jgi:hypothetical protein
MPGRKEQSSWGGGGGVIMHLGEHGEEYGTENIQDAIIMGWLELAMGL